MVYAQFTSGGVHTRSLTRVDTIINNLVDRVRTLYM